MAWTCALYGHQPRRTPPGSGLEPACIISKVGLQILTVEPRRSYKGRANNYFLRINILELAEWVSGGSFGGVSRSIRMAVSQELRLVAVEQSADPPSLWILPWILDCKTYELKICRQPLTSHLIPLRSPRYPRSTSFLMKFSSISSHRQLPPSIFIQAETLRT
jgi:hypothetical protein